MRRAPTPEATTDVSGKNSHGVMENENAKAMLARSADPRETRSSVNQSHVPETARRSFRAPCRVNARPSGSARDSSVKGEYAADCPFAASGPPQPFQRLR